MDARGSSKKVRGGLRAGLALLALLLIGGLVAPSAAAGEVPAPPGSACADGPAGSAATLVSEQPTLAGVERIEGIQAAIVVDPMIPPGIASALLEIGGRWCPVEWFNAAAAEWLPNPDPVSLAKAFASVAAMQYLGEVAVEDVAVAGPAVHLVTMGGRHGAESRWVVTVDDAGVRAASFTTLSWNLTDGVVGEHGSAGSHASIEGVTSLPGHTRTFRRAPDGRVLIDAGVEDLLERSIREREAAVRRAATLAHLPPGDDLRHEFEDGLVIKVSYGMSPYTPDSGQDTGVAHADRLRTMLKGAVMHYEDFMRWGVTDPFGNAGRTVGGNDIGGLERAGYINVDSPLTPVCIACAFLTDAMELHVAYLTPEILQLVAPVSYPDSEKLMQTVIGHEMVHSLQGGYGNGSGATSLGSAFIEGLARASESLHDIAGNSFQPGAMSYVDNSNGCEGFDNGASSWIEAQARGPFDGHTYDACYFWWTYLAAHGPEGFVDLLESLPAALASGGGSSASRSLRLLALASPEGDAAVEMARWGAAAAAGSSADGFTIPAGRTGERFDWFSLLFPAARGSTLEFSHPVSVSGGGVRAYTVTQERAIGALPGGSRAHVFDIVDRQLVPAEAGAGTCVYPGQILTVVAPSATDIAGSLETRFPFGDECERGEGEGP